MDVIYFLTELVLIVASGWCYRQLLLPMRAGRGWSCFPREAGQPDGAAVHRADVPCPACIWSRTSPWGGLWRWRRCWRQPGRVGSPQGAVLGMAAGLSMDLAANGVPLYAMAFGLSGLAAGAVRGKGGCGPPGSICWPTEGRCCGPGTVVYPCPCCMRRFWALPRSSCCRSALCGGWGAGWLRREASPADQRGPGPGQTAAGGHRPGLPYLVRHHAGLLLSAQER